MAARGILSAHSLEDGAQFSCNYDKYQLDTADYEKQEDMVLGEGGVEEWAGYDLYTLHSCQIIKENFKTC